MISEDLKQQTVVTALNDMVRKGYFSISTIDRCAEILGVQTRGSEAYTLLSALHCIEFGKMPLQVRAQVPEWIKQVLHMEVFAAAEAVAEPDKPPQRQRFFHRLLPF